MYTLDDLDRSKPPRKSKFLQMKILCGHCNFKCCNSPSLEVETTPEEAEQHNLPERFPIAGKCRCLGETGCTLPTRPVFCRFFPLQLKGDMAVVSHWAVLNCPTAKDYTFCHRDQDGKYVHQRNKVGRNKQTNSPDVLVTDAPLEEFPNVVEMNATAVKELWGEQAFEELRHP